MVEEMRRVYLIGYNSFIFVCRGKELFHLAVVVSHVYVSYFRLDFDYI